MILHLLAYEISKAITEERHRHSSGVRFKAFPDTAGQAQTLSRNLAAEEHGSLRALVLIRRARFGLCGLIP